MERQLTCWWHERCLKNIILTLRYVCAIAIIMVTLSKLMAGGGVSLGRILTAVQESLRWVDRRTLVTPSSHKRVWKKLYKWVFLKRGPFTFRRLSKCSLLITLFSRRLLTDFLVLCGNVEDICLNCIKSFCKKSFSPRTLTLGAKREWGSFLQWHESFTTVDVVVPAGKGRPSSAWL